MKNAFDSRKAAEFRKLSEQYIELDSIKKQQFRAAVRQASMDWKAFPIVEGGDHRQFLLSYAQERLWFLWNLLP
ncbi:hypothetical protein AD948_00020, partial [Acetobacter senegalensis]